MHSQINIRTIKFKANTHHCIEHNELQYRLTDLTQCVGIQRVQSSRPNPKYGVPQGSVLGPKLFLIYSLPLEDIIWKHQLEFGLYSDDDQLYLVLKHNPEESELDRDRDRESKHLHYF